MVAMLRWKRDREGNPICPSCKSIAVVVAAGGNNYFICPRCDKR